MHCPFCRNTDTRVVDSREADDGAAIRRRRSCPSCEKRFTTVERCSSRWSSAAASPSRSAGRRSIAGVRKACQGRPVDEDALALLGQKVEDALRDRAAAEVPAHEVGLAILGPLRELDEVAYLRFASVYRSFESVEDFENEIADAPGRAPTRRRGSRAAARA